MELAELKAKIAEIVQSALQESDSVSDLDLFNRWKARYLGRKSAFRDLFALLGQMSATDKPEAGHALNEARIQLENRAEALESLIKASAKPKAQKEFLDVTLPGRVPQLGRKHPLRQVAEEVIDVLAGMGFDVALGPDIETDYYNFEALNTPPHHPARDMQDTFYLEGGLLLRTQTSAVQIRYMEKHRPPIKIVAPGRVYRCDSDVTHSPMFTQIEGLLVDRRITFGDLKGVLEAFLRQLYTEDTPVRFRPSYFPFTEPSAEVDIGCQICHGSGCRVCSGTGWLEVLGSGMVHPQVLRNVNIDPEEYTGFAFGMGVERLAMLRFGIHDIRIFFENDMRVLEQF